VDYRKLDPALAIALQDAPNLDDPTLLVFVHTERPPGAQEAAALERHGIRTGDGRGPFTATLSPRAVEDLSDQPWVRSLKLSQRLRPKSPQ
jgi:hypothetical protein